MNRRVAMTVGVIVVAMGIGAVYVGQIAHQHQIAASRRFAEQCVETGFTPSQCGFLAEIARHTDSADDTSALALSLSAAGLAAGTVKQ